MKKLNKNSLFLGSFIIILFTTILFIILVYIEYKKEYIYIFISLVSLTLLIILDYFLKFIFKYQKELIDQNNIYEQKIFEEIEKSRLVCNQSKSSSMKYFINKISHHWRQKLSVITLHASSISVKKEMGIQSETETISAMKDIVKTTQNLSDTLCVLGTGFNTKTDKANFILLDLVDNIVYSMEDILKKKKIKVSINIDKTIKIISYKNYLTDIILSILDNSINAFETISGKKKIILIDAYFEIDNLIIKINDNAGGIDEDIIHKIFDPYFTTKNDGQTEGLGLFVSRELMLNNLIGDIEIDNFELKIDNHMYKGVECMIIIKA